MCEIIAVISVFVTEGNINYIEWYFDFIYYFNFD